MSRAIAIGTAAAIVAAVGLAFIVRGIGVGRVVLAGGLILTRFLLAEGARVERFIDVHPRKVGTRIHGIPVEPPQALGAPPEDTHLVAAVGVRGIREEIRTALTGLGWVEGVHFTCAA